MDGKKQNNDERLLKIFLTTNESNIYHTVDGLHTFMKEKNEESSKMDEEMKEELNCAIEKSFKEELKRRGEEKKEEEEENENKEEEEEEEEDWDGHGFISSIFFSCLLCHESPLCRP